MRAKQLLIGLVTFVVAFAGSVFAAPAASAAPINGCPEAYFCFYFNSNFGGARADYFYSDANLDNELFNKNPGANGFGVQVKNNAASAVNNWSYYATVYYNSGCNGSVASQSFGAYGKGNFSEPMKNDNASFKWPASFGAFSDCAPRNQF